MASARRWLLAGLGAAITGTAWGVFSLPGTLVVSDLDTDFIGETAGDEAGGSLASVGDLNGDLIPDLVIGAARYPSPSSRGRVYVLFGKPGQPEGTYKKGISLADADVILDGEKDGDQAGWAVAGIGDINADGLSDFAVGAPLNADNGPAAGKVYVVFGKSSGWLKGPTSLATAALASYQGYTQERAGYAISAAGNLNGGSPKTDDFVIGNDNHTEGGKLYAGRAFFVFGKSSGWAKNVKLVDSVGATAAGFASVVGEGAYHLVGRALAGGLDLNADGLDDVVIGAPGTTPSGQTYRGQVGILFGRGSGWAKDQPLSTAANVLITGESDNHELGKVLTVSEDLTGDYISDLVVSAPSAERGTLTKAGKVYLFAGRSTSSWTSPLVASSATATWLGEARNDSAGSALAPAGDFNEDGLADLVIGAYLADTSQTNAGRAYVIFGRLTSFSGSSGLEASDVLISGTSYDARLAQSVAGFFDLDGDTIYDLALGAQKADPASGADAGAVYVLRGARFKDADGDGFSPFEGDCNDASTAQTPGKPEIAYDGIDQDCDGMDLVDVDGDGFSSTEVQDGTDCNDDDPAIKPGAPEACDGQDNDCDTQIDEGVKSTYYTDADSDSYGDPDSSVQACAPPTGTVTRAGDCDDSDPDRYPGAPETPYDGVDQSCDGRDLDDVDGDGEPGGPDGTDCNDDDPTFYSGADETPYDGFDQNCDGTDLTDVDEDGYDYYILVGGTDCNDNDAGIHPAATDVAYNGIDEDCSGSDLKDVDGDGFDADIAGGADCNDQDAAIYPGAEDVPNDIFDQDCDGVYALDEDGDGYSVPYGQDCDDTDPLSYPGAAEIAYDGKDQDCDEADLVDVDQDGIAAVQAGGSDCDDTRDDVFPGATEVSYDGVDQDCYDGDMVDLDNDGYVAEEAGGDDCDDTTGAVHPGREEIPGNDVDENCNEVASDQDGDGYGTSPDDFGLEQDCDDANPDRHPGNVDIPYDDIDQDCIGDDLTDVDGDGFDSTVVGGDDCEDEDPSIYPGADEILGDRIDNNCDGFVDEEDVDGDGVPAQRGDCDDENPSVYPGAEELPGDGIDNDCDSWTDEGIVKGEQDPGGCSCSSKGPASGGSGGAGLALMGLLFLLGCRARVGRTGSRR